MDHHTLGREIRDQRRLRGLTQQELATRIGVSLIVLKYVEGEKRSPRACVSASTLAAIARDLGITSDVFAAGARM